MAALRELIAEVKIKLNNKEIVKIIGQFQNLKKNIDKIANPPTNFNVSIDPKSYAKLVSDLNKLKKKLNNSLYSETGSKKLNSNINKITGSLQTLTSFAKAAAIALGSMIVLKTFSFLKDMFTSTGKEVRELNALSLATGLSQRSLETFDYAAKKAGSSVEGSRSALQTFTGQLEELKETGLGNIDEPLARLGVSLHDSTGRWKSNETQLRDVLDALSKFKDKSAAARIAVKLFGQEAYKLAPLLLGELGSFEKIAGDLDRTGGRLTESAKKESLRLLDIMNDFDSIFKGLKSSAITSFLPPLNSFMKKLENIFITNKSAISERVGEFFRVLSDNIPQTDKDIESLTKKFEGLVSIIETLGTAGGVVIGIFKPLTRAWEAVVDIFFTNLEAMIYEGGNPFEAMKMYAKAHPREGANLGMGNNRSNAELSEALARRRDRLNSTMNPDNSFYNPSNLNKSNMTMNPNTSINIDVNAQGTGADKMATMISEMVYDAISSANEDAIRQLVPMSR